MASYLGLSVGRIVGVMKTTNSRFGLVVLDFDLKSQPRNGMSPKNGTFWMDSATSCWGMPAIARVSPSLTTTCVMAVRLLMAGINEDAAPTVACRTSSPLELFSTLTTILILMTSPGSLMTVGVTSSLRSASLNWTWVPAELTVEYGISLPSEIIALAFSSVTTSGFASDVVLFSTSSASRTRLIFSFRAMSPKAMPAGVVPAHEAGGESGEVTLFPPPGRPPAAPPRREVPKGRVGVLAPPPEPPKPGGARGGPGGGRGPPP